MGRGRGGGEGTVILEKPDMNDGRYLFSSHQMNGQCREKPCKFNHQSIYMDVSVWMFSRFVLCLYIYSSV